MNRRFVGAGRSGRPLALMRTRPYPRVIRGYPVRPYRPAYPQFNQVNYDEDSYEESGSDYYPEYEDYEEGEGEGEDSYDYDEEETGEDMEEEETGDDEDDDFVSHFCRFTPVIPLK